MNYFPQTKTIFCDNEASLNSATIKSILLKQIDVHGVNAPPLHSTSNGQVERLHSTLLEIARCLKLERKIDDTVDLILEATIAYNRTIHSITSQKPIDMIHSCALDFREAIKKKIKKAQEELLDRHNRTRQDKSFQVGDKVVVKTNRKLGNKLTPLGVDATIEADLGTTVLIKGRVVHKDNLK